MGRRIIKLSRRIKFKSSILGILESEGKTWYTLEPQWRNYAKGEKKVAGKSAIPPGLYKLQKYYSPKHKRLVPMLCEVPNFQNVEIHIGNYDRDTKGCILISTAARLEPDEFVLIDSTTAFNELMAVLTNDWAQGTTVYLQVDDPFSE